MAAESRGKGYGSGRHGNDEVKKIIYRPEHKLETAYKKDWADIFITILAWLCIIFLPVTIIVVVVWKIKNEIRFWKWLFHGMPNMANHRWYALSVIGTIGFIGLCSVIAVIDAVSEKIRKSKQTMKVDNENF